MNAGVEAGRGVCYVLSFVVGWALPTRISKKDRISPVTTNLPEEPIMKYLPIMLFAILWTVPVFAAEDEGFARLFDGKSFDGWEGNLKVFRIEDGAIVGGSLDGRVARNEFLCVKGEYADFELRLKFKLLGHGANAGVQIRSQRIKDHHEMIGYQADMGAAWWGCLYDESRRRKMLAAPAKDAWKKFIKADDWNDYVIRCEGPRIQLWINGRQTVDYTEPDKQIPLTGRIAVQIHGGPPSEAWYKDIRIKVLPKK